LGTPRGFGDRWLPGDLNDQHLVLRSVCTQAACCLTFSSCAVDWDFRMVTKCALQLQVEELMKQDAVFVAMEELMLALEEER
jgi:hypothetical protein